MKKIKLRALTSEDLLKTFEWHNQEDISQLYSGHPFPVNIEMERAWYEKVLHSNIPTSVFAIESVSDREMIGITLLKDINMINRNSEFAIYVGEKKYRGQGLGEEATVETFRFGFHQIGLNRIYLKVLSRNHPAIKLYEKIGMKREGILRKSVFKNNEYNNELVLSILKEEFDGLF